MNATHKPDPAEPHPSAELGHEPSDFSYRQVLWILPMSVAILIAFTLVCVYWFTGVGDREIESKQTWSSWARDYSLLRAKEDEILNGYGWADRNAGRVRIPVRRAMELVAQEAANGTAPRAAAGTPKAQGNR